MKIEDVSSEKLRGALDRMRAAKWGIVFFYQLEPLTIAEMTRRWERDEELSIQEIRVTEQQIVTELSRRNQCVS